MASWSYSSKNIKMITPNLSKRRVRHSGRHGKDVSATLGNGRTGGQTARPIDGQPAGVARVGARRADRPSFRAAARRRTNRSQKTLFFRGTTPKNAFFKVTGIRWGDNSQKRFFQSSGPPLGGQLSENAFFKVPGVHWGGNSKLEFWGDNSQCSFSVRILWLCQKVGG